MSTIKIIIAYCSNPLWALLLEYKFRRMPQNDSVQGLQWASRVWRFRLSSFRPFKEDLMTYSCPGLSFVQGGGSQILGVAGTVLKIS